MANELELIKNYREKNCQKSFNILYDKFDKYITKYSWTGKWFDEDLKQILSYSLVKAINDFDYKSKNCLITVLDFKIKGDRQNYLRKANRVKRKGIEIYISEIEFDREDGETEGTNYHNLQNKLSYFIDYSSVLYIDNPKLYYGLMKISNEYKQPSRALKAKWGKIDHLFKNCYIKK